jgi:hypothetical protein
METDALLSHERDQLLDHIMRNFIYFHSLMLLITVYKTANCQGCGRVSKEEIAVSTWVGLIKMSISRAEI